MIEEKRLSSEFDFHGPLSDLIQVTKACEKAGLDVRNMINVLRRPDKKEVLKEINEYSYRKTASQKELEARLAQEERAKDYGYRNYNEDRASLSELRDM